MDNIPHSPSDIATSQISVEDGQNDAIAIIGMAGRFPGAADIDAFWRNLSEGVESIRFFSTDELVREGIPLELIKHPNYIPAKGMLDDIALFDAGFFGYSAREAEYLDPQQRLFLECCWQALERAAYDSARYPGIIGCYASVSLSTYGLALLENSEQAAGVATISAFDKDFLTSRAAFHLDLRGPCVTMQSACSSSLAAVHFACQSLISGECDMMLAGGVSVSIPQRAGYVHQAGGIGSSDGHCRAFDSQGDGTLSGDAVAVVVLKRLADAIADRDHIHGIILGSAVSNDGAVRSGFSAPGVDGQLRAIRSAQLVAGVTADSIGYVEAHGTGTALGDPIELAALTQAFRMSTQKRQYCALGSVKTNIGHTDAAAGVAGLIKATLALEKGEIPPSLNFQEANPECRFDSSPFYVCQQLTPWPVSEQPRRAGVSSFGLGGTNAHIVLQDAPKLTSSRNTAQQPELIVLSARSDNTLQQATAQLAEYLDHQQVPCLADIAFTYALGRRSFSQRCFVLANTHQAIVTALRQPRTIKASAEPPTLYLHLPDWSDAALIRAQAGCLYHGHVLIKAIMDQVLEELPSGLAAPLRSELSRQQAEDSFGLSQALGCLLQISIGQALQRWGIPAIGVWGQGTSIFAAAALAGLVGANEAVQLAAADHHTLLNLCTLFPVTSPRLELRLGHRGEGCNNLRDLAQNAHWLHETSILCDEPNWLSQQTGTAILVLGDQPGFGISPQRRCFSVLPATAETSYFGLLKALGDLWCRGFEPDWQLFYQGQQRARVPLPTYPFQRQHYFFSKPTLNQSAKANPQLTETPVTNTDAFEPRLSVAYWRQTQPLIPPQYLSSETCWLIFCDANGFANVLAQRLELAGQSVWRVKLGIAFKHEGQTISLVADDVAHYQSLAKCLPQSTRLHIVHAWALDELGTGHERFKIAQSRGLFSVLGLVKALAGRSSTTQLLIISAPTERILGNEILTPAWATLRGAVLTIPWELPYIDSRWIEIQATPDYSAWLLESVLAEFNQMELSSSDTPQDRIIAYRGQQRWQRQFEPLLSIPSTSRLRQNGVYVITGACGGIGQLLANFLFHHYRARLILLAHSLPSATSEAGQRIAAWQEQGYEFLILPLELGKEQKPLELGLAQASERFGPIQGIFHAAGRAGGGLISHRKPMDLWPELAAKALALEQLAELLPFNELDVVMLFSAHTSLTGGLGQVGYAAANAFLDSYAQASFAKAPVCAVNWDRWQGVGMAHAAEQLAQKLTGTVLPGGLSAEQGIAQCANILSLPACTQVIVSAGPLERIWQSPVRTPAVQVTSQDERNFHPRPDDLAHAFEPLSNAIERSLAELWQNLFSIAPIGRQDDFFDLGGHSLLAVELVDEIRKMYQIELPLECIFDAPTLAELAGCIEASLSAPGQQSTAAAENTEYEEGSL